MEYFIRKDGLFFGTYTENLMNLEIHFINFTFGWLSFGLKILEVFSAVELFFGLSRFENRLGNIGLI